MKDRTKNTILDVSRRLFAGRGLGKTKVEHIVQEAGISRATFYNYFHSKEEIFFYLIETEINQIQSEADRGIEGETDPYRMMRTYCLKVILGAREMTRFLGLNGEAQEPLPPAPKKLVETSYRRSIVTITRILRSGIESGAFTISNTELTAHIILSALEIYINPGKLGGIREESLEAQLDELMEVLFYGFSKRDKAGSGRAVGRNGMIQTG
jgi:AcrR family transcriptional regulator